MLFKNCAGMLYGYLTLRPTGTTTFRFCFHYHQHQVRRIKSNNFLCLSESALITVFIAVALRYYMHVYISLVSCAYLCSFNWSAKELIIISLMILWRFEVTFGNRQASCLCIISRCNSKYRYLLAHWSVQRSNDVCYGLLCEFKSLQSHCR